MFPYLRLCSFNCLLYHVSIVCCRLEAATTAAKLSLSHASSFIII